MAEENNEAPQIRMSMITQFVRDLSFENILAQKGSTASEITPNVQVAVNLDARKRDQEHQYDVQQKVRISSTNTVNDETLFVIELDYATIFHVEGLAENQLHPFLLVECPRMMFPFIRRIVADVARDGGLPPLNLDVIDYLELYRKNAAKLAETQAQA